MVHVNFIANRDDIMMAGPFPFGQLDGIRVGNEFGCHHYRIASKHLQNSIKNEGAPKLQK